MTTSNPRSLVQRLLQRFHLDRLTGMSHIELAAAKIDTPSLTTILTTLGHEIRTPLNALLGRIELARDASLSDAMVKDHLHHAILAGQQLSELLQTLLESARWQSGSPTLADTPFTPRRLVTEVSELYGELVRQKGLLFHEDNRIPAGLVARGDATRIRQILVNLLSNALKFTEFGSIALIATAKILPGHDTESGCELTFRIEDTGPGIPAQQYQHLFQPFTRCNATVSGTGLGLYLSKQLSDAMNATLEVSSLAGGGTLARLRLTLPVGASDDEIRLTDGPSPESRHYHALVVDDSEPNRLLILHQLSHLGFKVTLAESSRQALDIWQPGDFDITLVDCVMPGLSGPELVSQLRSKERESGREAALIFGLTGLVDADARMAFIGAGAQACLEKPLSLETLTGTLQSWLPQRKADSVSDMTAPTPCQHLDIMALRRLSQGNTVFERQFLTSVLENNERDESLIRQAYDSENLMELHTLLHRLVSIVRMVMNDDCAAPLQQLAKAARYHDQQAIDGCFQEAMATLPPLNREIRDYLTQLPPIAATGHEPV